MGLSHLTLSLYPDGMGQGKACGEFTKRLEWGHYAYGGACSKSGAGTGVRMIVALAGGVGAAKLLRGLVDMIAPETLTIISNTGDDIELYGLHISPDIDIVAYTLSGLVDEERGWGIRAIPLSAWRCCNVMAKRRGSISATVIWGRTSCARSVGVWGRA